MSSTKTPWQRVFDKFGLHQAQLAHEIGRHRSKVSRAIKDDHGLISGKDQELLLSAAKRLGIKLSPADLTPNV